MRALLLGILVLCLGCTTTAATQRLAFAPIPGTPQGLAGGRGVSLSARFLTSEPVPQAEGGAVSLPRYQPELGVVVRIDERTRFNVRVSAAAAAMAASQPVALPRLPTGAFTLETVAGVAHDVPFAKRAGVLFGGELGATGVSFTEQTGPFVDSWAILLMTMRGALGLYADPGPVRLFAAASLGTGTWNDSTGIVTSTCTVLLPCTRSDSGRVTVAAVAHAGGGIRWQPHELVSLVAEAWVPLTEVATKLPVTVMVALRVGDLSVASGRRGAAPVAPPALTPPPLPEPPPPALIPL